MITTWTCECGNVHPLIRKYCNKCGRPMPKSTLNAVIKEETKLHRRRNTSLK